MPEQNRNNMGTNLSTGFVNRVVNGVKGFVNGVTGATFFGPAQPIAPTAPDAKGRQFDYPVGFNIKITPRENEAVSFASMRALADAYDLLRLVIETRKDQIAKLNWDFMKSGSDETDEDPNVKFLRDFFKRPDKVHDFDTWLRMLLEDLFVCDAPTIYVAPTLGGISNSKLGGGVWALEVLDGTTIKRTLDEHGRTPQPPSVAYQQVLHGLPAVDYSSDELIYAPRNIRTSKIYGYGPVEQIIITVNIALRRQIFQLNYYTEGNIPEAVCAVPDDWAPDKIKQFQLYWDTIMEGDLKQRRKMKFVPGGMKPEVIHKDGMKDEFDEWLARIVCYAFSVPPTPFVKQMNRATAQTVHSAALEEGLLPLQKWIKSLLDYIIQKYLGLPEYECMWKDKDKSDPVANETILQQRLKTGVININEYREEIGYERIADDIGNTFLIYSGTGAIRLEDAVKEPVIPTEPDASLLLPGKSGQGAQGAKFESVDDKQSKVGQGKQKQLPAPKDKKDVEKLDRPIKEIATRTKIDSAAHEAATSNRNDQPLPTDAQRQAGNYKKGHITLHGLEISIENPKGSTRSGDGWSQVMQNHYGYIRGTKGADKDHIDAFIGDHPESEVAYVIDQHNQNGDFDEHKVILGAVNEAEARQTYGSNYSLGWSGLGSIKEFTIPQLKVWLDQQTVNNGGTIKKSDDPPVTKSKKAFAY